MYSQIAHCYCIGVRNVLILQRKSERGLRNRGADDYVFGQFRRSLKLSSNGKQNGQESGCFCKRHNDGILSQEVTF